MEEGAQAAAAESAERPGSHQQVETPTREQEGQEQEDPRAGEAATECLTPPRTAIF